MTACRNCGFDPDGDPFVTLVAIRGRKQMIVESVALVEHPRSGKYYGRSVLVVGVKERNDAIFSTRERDQSPTAPVCTGDGPLPALQPDLPAQEGQTEMPVLQKAARKPAGAVKP